MNKLFGTRWWSWPRLLCLAFTGAMLTFIFSRLDRDALRHSFAHLRPGWFAAAFVLYGLALVFAGARWHITLHAIRCAVHVGASVRLAFIGHFLFVVLFGAAAGDVAKAALYARWYRFGVPELTASTPIDRTLGSVAALVVGGLALLLGWFSGGFENLPAAPFHLAPIWIVLAAVVLVALVAALLLWRPAGETWWARGWRTMRVGFRNFTASRRNSPSACCSPWPRNSRSPASSRSASAPWPATRCRGSSSRGRFPSS